MPCRATSLASSTTDQRDSPGGGGLHASATTAASLRASNFFGGFGRGSSLRAASRPRCRYRRPTRRTSRGNVPAASAVSCIVHPLSSSSRIRIRRHRRIDRRFRPALIAASAFRSASFRLSPGNRSTACFFGCFTHRYRSFLDPQRKSDPHVSAEGLGQRPTAVGATRPAARTASTHRGQGPAERLFGVNVSSTSRERIVVRTRPNSPSSNHVPPHRSHRSTSMAPIILALRSASQSGHFILESG
jgi:hypothetical protein